MNTIEIPVLLLTGYLGSGKTTLVNHILSNKRGIKFAVIVNDIGEVNIDADLIQKGGVVGKKDDSLVALQNGCICCTLKTDLIEQMFEIMKMQRFDYIVIEARALNALILALNDSVAALVALLSKKLIIFRAMLHFQWHISVEMQFGQNKYRCFDRK